MLKLRDVMSRELITMSPELSIRDAMDLLARNHVSGAPVVASGKVVGVVSSTDLLAFAASLPGVPTEHAAPEDEWDDQPGWEDEEPAAAFFTQMWSDAGAESGERMQESGGPEWNALEEHTVSEAMTRDVCSLSSDAPVTQAAEYMVRAGIHRLLVIDDGALAGIVSSTDISRVVASHKLQSRTYVFGREKDFDDRY